MVAGLYGFHALPDFDHHAGAFMAENRGERAFRILAAERERIGMADPGGLEFHHDLARLRAFEIDFTDFQRLARRECHCCFGFHRLRPHRVFPRQCCTHEGLPARVGQMWHSPKFSVSNNGSHGRYRLYARCLKLASLGASRAALTYQVGRKWRLLNTN